MYFAIIAAGEGQRLRSEGIILPKPLIRINNIPMLERLFGIINDQQPESISIIINEEAKEVYDFISNHYLRDRINLKIKSTESSLHSLYELKTFLQDKPFCLFTVDTIFSEFEFKNFINFINTKKSIDGALGITEYIDDEKPLYAELNKDNLITKFDDLKISRFVTGGIYYFSPQVYKEIEYAVKNNYKRLRNFLKLIIEKHYLLQGFIFSKIIDVDHINDIKSAQNFLMFEENLIQQR